MSNIAQYVETGDHDFSERLQLEIDRAARLKHPSHKKWPLVTDGITIPSGVYHAHKPIRLLSGVDVGGKTQSSAVIVSHLRDDEPLFYSDPSDELYATKVHNLHAVSATRFNGDFLKIFNANRNCKFEDIFAEQFRIGMWSRDCFTTAFRDIGIYQCGEGFVGENLTNGRLEAIKVENCASNGLRLSPSDSNTSAGTEIRGFVAQGNGQCGVLVEGVDQVSFHSLFLEGNNREAMRRPGDDAIYAQLRLTADRNLVNKRNGSVTFNDTFITRGHSKIVGGLAVDIQSAENVAFSGGYIRTFAGAFASAFNVGVDANLVDIAGMTFQGFPDDAIVHNHGGALVMRSRLLSSRGEGRPYHRH